MKKNSYIITTILILFISINSTNAQSKESENESINQLIKKRREYNQKNGTGFIIQLYNGSEATAKSILSSFKSKYNWVATKLVYDAPDWKTQVGNYRTRLDADKALNKYKEDFSGGIIIKK